MGKFKGSKDIKSIWVQKALENYNSAGVDTGYFRHQYTDFGHTNLGMLKFDLMKN